MERLKEQKREMYMILKIYGNSIISKIKVNLPKKSCKNGK